MRGVQKEMMSKNLHIFETKSYEINKTSETINHNDSIRIYK
jgi:hypothetical protein